MPPSSFLTPLAVSALLHIPHSSLFPTLRPNIFLPMSRGMTFAVPLSLEFQQIAVWANSIQVTAKVTSSQMFLNPQEVSSWAALCRICFLPKYFWDQSNSPLLIYRHTTTSINYNTRSPVRLKINQIPFGSGVLFLASLLPPLVVPALHAEC